MNANTIKERIIELNKKGYPFKEIYKLAGVPWNNFSNFMNDKHVFSDKSIEKINDAIKKIEENYPVKKFERIPKKYL